MQPPLSPDVPPVLQASGTVAWQVSFGRFGRSKPPWRMRLPSVNWMSVVLHPSRRDVASWPHRFGPFTRMPTGSSTHASFGDKNVGDDDGEIEGETLGSQPVKGMASQISLVIRIE
jgi:hypothetical protein